LDYTEGTVTGIPPDGAPDPDSQFEEKLYVVVTRYVTDAFDRLRERWPSMPWRTTPFVDQSCQVRICQVAQQGLSF
jgi:hypothetical protein